MTAFEQQEGILIRRTGWAEVVHRWAQQDLDDPMMIRVRERTGTLPGPHCLIPNDHPARYAKGFVDRPLTWPANI